MNRLQTTNLIGLTEEEADKRAREYNCITRVVKSDGNYRIVSRDYREDRFNLHLLEGVVVYCTVG